MFGLSAKAVYGLEAMVELARRPMDTPVQIRELAEARGIPQHYLEQIMVQLRRAGLVGSTRGAQGGYRLSRDPGSIRTEEVLQVLEGPLEVVGGESERGSLSFLWDELGQAIRGYLRLSIADLVDREDQARQALNYSI